MLNALPRRKIRDVVAGHLTAYISVEGLKPGDRLPTEAALAEKFGVSRLSLREATKALEFLGIVASKPGVGMSVGSVDLDRVTSYLGFHPALQEAPALNLIETRIVIETGVLPYLSRRMREQPAIYDELTAINDSLRGVSKLAEWLALDIAFHRRMIESSGLTPLVAFNDLITVFFQRFRESVAHARRGWNQGIASHQRMLDSLRDGKVDQANTEVEQHIRSHQAYLGIS